MPTFADYLELDEINDIEEIEVAFYDAVKAASTKQVSFDIEINCVRW